MRFVTHNPRQLIILDIYENNAYEIEQELKRRHPELNLLTLIASIRDEVKINDVFKKYKPEIVFNAAAHKHVPLMETSPNEAVKNNVFGTLNVAKCADKYKSKVFVQISTDKAVNPTNIMGATKRICEMIIQTIGRHSKHTNFVAVRDFYIDVGFQSGKLDKVASQIVYPYLLAHVKYEYLTAAGVCACLQDERNRFRYRHEIPYYVLMGNRYGTALRYLLFKQRNYRMKKGLWMRRACKKRPTDL